MIWKPNIFYVLFVIYSLCSMGCYGQQKKSSSTISSVASIYKYMLDEIASENEIPFEIIVQDTTIKYQYGMFPGKFTVPFEGSCGHELQKLENRVGVNPSVLKHSVSLNKLEPQIILEVAFSDVASCSHNGSIIVYAQVIAKDKMSYDIVGKSNTLYLMETSDGGLKVLHRHVVSVR